MRAARFVIVLFLLGSGLAQGAEFDHRHTAWQALLQKHVSWVGGAATQVDYAAVQADRAALDGYTASLQQVTRVEFDAWSQAQQLAFLINAYNAFTVQLILTKYPALDSIKQIGGWFGNPWKQTFFSLLGERRHLDAVEHELIRGSGRYNEPRIHVAVVCASIGCPALRPEAFVAESLDAQLTDSMRRFLADRSRNHYKNGVLRVSKIFDWYSGDFPDLAALFAAHAEQLAGSSIERQRVRTGAYKLAYSDYDWSLNDRR